MPLVAAQLIGANWGWQAIYAACALMAVPLLILYWPNRLSADTPAPVSESTTSIESSPSLLAIGFTPIMWCYYGLLAAYVAAELSLGAWMMEYLQQRHQFSVDRSSRYLSAFFVMLMLGRLLGAWVVERVNYLWAVAVALIATGVCIAAGLLINRQLFSCCQSQAYACRLCFLQ